MVFPHALHETQCISVYLHSIMISRLYNLSCHFHNLTDSHYQYIHRLEPESIYIRTTTGTTFSDIHRVALIFLLSHTQTVG